MSKELEQRAEELEQTLAKQLELLKKDSEEWLKVGAVVLVAGLLTYGIVKATRKKKVNKTEKALEALEQQGLLTKEIEEKLRKPSKSSFWPSVSQRLLFLGLALAKEKFLNNLLNPQPENAQAQEKSR
ncbi:MAG: hypothetical protein PSV36_14330 [Algoriphagus sp.]|nr:hypothetical protein [Algoriphagus sp.]